MLVRLLGVSHLNFTSNDGKAISGTNIFVGYKEENTQGLRTDRYFLKEGISLPKDVKLNDTINLYFNNKGKVESIEPAG